MTGSTEVVAVDLSESERSFIWHALGEWQNSAAWKPFPIEVLGLSTWNEFDELTGRLAHAVTDGQALAMSDWARMLYLTECSWASSLVGAALDFSVVTGFSDTEALGLLRGLQRKSVVSIRLMRCSPAADGPAPSKNGNAKAKE
jgi:hypothetical protein